MSIKGIPTSKELELRIKSRYSYFQLTSKDSNESKRKVIKIKEDLKAFMKSSSALLEPSDKQIISNAMRNIQILGASLLPPAFFINYKLSSQKKPWFRSLSFGMRTISRIMVVGVPIFITYYYSYHLNQQIALYIEDKYAERVQQYLITQDPKIINPNN